MSNYSASIYSVDESGVAPASPPAFAPSPSYSPLPLLADSPRHLLADSPPPLFAAPPSRPPPSFPPSSSAPPPPPAASARAARPSQTLSEVFSGAIPGDGMKDLSEITVLAELVVTTIDRDTKLGRLVGSIKQKMLHQTPEFVGALGELAEKTGSVARLVRLTEHFRELELWRVDAALVNTLKVLRAMTASLLSVASGARKLAKHVRTKVLDRLGKLHYGIEQLVRGLESLLNFRLVEFDILLQKLREVRTVLKGQNGEEEPNNA